MKKQSHPRDRVSGQLSSAASDALPLADSAGFDLLGRGLGRDVEAALDCALSEGAVFACGHDALVIFRHALAAAIRNIENHERGRLFQDFLRIGPYEDAGEIPSDMAGTRLSDEDTARAIAFIHSYIVNCFKGAVAELLATKPCARLLKRLQREGALPPSARLYVGDSVAVRGNKGNRFLKGADMHVLIGADAQDAASHIAVAGVAEVKSYIRSQHLLREQLDMHLRRAARGLLVSGEEYPAENTLVGYGKNRRVIRIAIVPDTWELPRSFRFEDAGDGRALQVDEGRPRRGDDDIARIGEDEWTITLRWSREAIAEAAYEMTFWYMGKIGEVVFRDKNTGESASDDEKAHEAGRNAAKMMLYYAILRCRTAREEQRAIALYNSYGFGYALGMNFMNAEGRREMLWPDDLDGILATGKTVMGCFFR